MASNDQRLILQRFHILLNGIDKITAQDMDVAKQKIKSDRIARKAETSDIYSALAEKEENILLEIEEVLAETPDLAVQPQRGRRKNLLSRLVELLRTDRLESVNKTLLAEQILTPLLEKTPKFIDKRLVESLHAIVFDDNERDPDEALNLLTLALAKKPELVTKDQFDALTRHVLLTGDERARDLVGGLIRAGSPHAHADYCADLMVGMIDYQAPKGDKAMEREAAYVANTRLLIQTVFKQKPDLEEGFRELTGETDVREISPHDPLAPLAAIFEKWAGWRNNPTHSEPLSMADIQQIKRTEPADRNALFLHNLIDLVTGTAQAEVYDDLEPMIEQCIKTVETRNIPLDYCLGLIMDILQEENDDVGQTVDEKRKVLQTIFDIHPQRRRDLIDYISQKPSMAALCEVLAGKMESAGIRPVAP